MRARSRGGSRRTRSVSAAPGAAESASSVPSSSTTITRPPRSRSELSTSACSCASVVEPALGARGEQLRLVLGLALDLCIHPPRQVQRERHLQRHDHEHEHVREREQQSRPQAHGASSSAAAKRKPTPRTVWMKRGSAESSPSLRRRLDTWTSSVFVEPNQLVSQTSSMRRSRVMTVPASLSSSWSSSNSRRVRSSSLPCRAALRLLGSSVSSPTSQLLLRLGRLRRAPRRGAAPRGSWPPPRGR